jgi:hypothetical protein
MRQIAPRSLLVAACPTDGPDIDLDRVDAAGLPAELAVTAVTMAELAAGPHATLGHGSYVVG